jgi:hypothetical protein
MVQGQLRQKSETLPKKQTNSKGGMWLSAQIQGPELKCNTTTKQTNKQKTPCWLWWPKPVVPAMLEAEVRGSSSKDDLCKRKRTYLEKI